MQNPDTRLEVPTLSDDELMAATESLLFANWRYKGCWIVGKPGNWRVYNADTNTFLGSGYPTVSWDRNWGATYGTTVQAMEGLANCRHPPKLATHKDQGKAEAAAALLAEVPVAINVEELVKSWAKSSLKSAQPEPAATPLPVGFWTNLVSSIKRLLERNQK